MPDNPQRSQHHWFGLSDHRLVAISGRDAVAFAQAQTMNDVAVLRDGEWHWNGWLTAKGRVIALFAVIRMDADTLWMVLPDADAEAFAAQLRRFVFRSKVAITVRDDLQIAGRLCASDVASGNHWAGDPLDAIELDLSGALVDGHLGRSLRIAPSLVAPVDVTALETWHRTDLEHGWPRLDSAQSEQWTPQQLSLGRLRAYSVKKGCYPGQEIVARTHFLGQAKRGLALIQSATPLAAGTELVSQGLTVGTVVSACGKTALAVLPLSLEQDALQMNEGPAASGEALWVIRILCNGLGR